MGDKGAQKKAYIIEKARGVFAEKGFKAVTMKDIVDACEFSRGGLNLYIESSAQLFEAVLQQEVEEDDDEAVARALANDATASDMLALFIKEQKKSILRKKNNLTVATYEYYSMHPDAHSPLKEQFEAAVTIVTKLIENGVESGEFICGDPMGCARNLMYVMEGLRICSRTMGVTEEMMDREILFVLQGIDPETYEPQ